MIRPFSPKYGTFYGLCNQLAFVFYGLKRADAQGLEEVTIGVCNRDIFNIGDVPFNSIFDLSGISFTNLKTIHYEKEAPSEEEFKKSDFKMELDFHVPYIRQLNFSKEIQENANKIISTLPLITAIIHSKLEEDSFRHYTKQRGIDRVEYEQNLIEKYKETVSQLPPGNWLVMCHFKHNFWDKYPNAMHMEKENEFREVSAAIEMCVAITLLRSNKSIEFVSSFGSSFSHVIKKSIFKNTKVHSIQL